MLHPSVPTTPFEGELATYQLANDPAVGATILRVRPKTGAASQALWIVGSTLDQIQARLHHLSSIQHPHGRWSAQDKAFAADAARALQRLAPTRSLRQLIEKQIQDGRHDRAVLERARTIEIQRMDTDAAHQEA